MNYLRLSLAASALTLILGISAFGGEMHTPVAAPAPPATGEMGTPAAATGEIQTTVATEIALSLMQGVLSLF